MKITHTIPWLNYGIDFEPENALYLPVTLIKFFHSSKLSDSDKAIILRIYSLLQIGANDEEDTMKLLLGKMENKEYIQESSDEILKPLYVELYPTLKNSKTGYNLFIDGEMRSLPFPSKILDILKAMELNDKDFKPKNKTSKFILNFIFELVNDNGEVFLSDEFYVGDKKLSKNKNNLLFAVAKTCYEIEHNTRKRSEGYFDTAVKITNGLVINDIITESTKLEHMRSDELSFTSENNVYDNLTRLFFRNKFGDDDDVVETIANSTLNEWRSHWETISKESNIPVEELETVLMELFDKEDSKYIPMPWSKSVKNPAFSLSMKLKQLKKGSKNKRKSNNVLVLLEED